MGISNPNYKSTYNLLRGLRGLISAAITGFISTLNLQAGFYNAIGEVGNHTPNGRPDILACTPKDPKLRPQTHGVQG